MTIGSGLGGPLDFNSKSALDDADHPYSNVGRAADMLVTVDQQVLHV
jgi:hypothetical protein